MKRLLLSACAAAALAFAQGPARAADHYLKVATYVHVQATGQCIIFELAGVETADPGQPGSPWFGLRRDHPAFAELFAVLLTGAAGKRTINVHTSSYTCGGVAHVASITLN
jgi:hypothetical protein